MIAEMGINIYSNLNKGDKIMFIFLFEIKILNFNEKMMLIIYSFLFSAIAQVALGSVQGYHGMVLACGLYGASLGGALYSLKMLALERLRSSQFARSWALVQAAEALPILFGVPLTGLSKTHFKILSKREISLNSKFILNFNSIFFGHFH